MFGPAESKNKIAVIGVGNRLTLPKVQLRLTRETHRR
jgi:hypothetical protein